MKNYFIIFCILLLLYLPIKAGDIFNEYQMQPEVYHFVKPQYGTVDAQGDLNLNIPVMTVPGRNGLDFPISFSCRSSITVSQSASWIGLGWDWDPGSITRDVKGAIVYFDSVLNRNISANVDFPWEIPNDPIARDVYYFHMDGSTMPVYKSINGGPNSFKPENDFYPQEWRQWKFDFDPNEINIITVGNNSGNNIQVSTNMEDFGIITVTKEDGTRYLFGMPTLAYYYNLPDDGLGTPYHDDTYVSVWRLEAILSPEYETDDLPTGSESGGWIRFYYKYDTNYDVRSLLAYNSGPVTLTQLTYLDYILTPTHKAIFTTTIRNDEDLKVDDVAVHKKLDCIELYSRNDLLNPIQTVDLLHGTIAGSQSNKTSLSGMNIYGSDLNQVPQKYSFTYYDETIDAKVAKSLGRYDDFGYYNYSSSWYGFNDSATDGRAWSIESVTYPSGGKEIFEYENDEIATPSSVQYYNHIITHPGDSGLEEYKFRQDALTVNNEFENWQGGVRVKKIKRYDGMGNESIFNYFYTNLDVDLSQLPPPPEPSLSSGHATAVPPMYFARNERSAVNLGGGRGKAAVFYDAIDRQNPDGSYTRTIYSRSNHVKTLRFGQFNYSNTSILQDNSTWMWGKKLVEENNCWANMADQITEYNYSPAAHTLSENSPFSVYPIYYKMYINYLNSTKETVEGLEHLTEYAYKSSAQVESKTEYNSDGETRKTSYTYAYEQYPNLANDYNIFAPVTRTDVSKLISNPTLTLLHSMGIYVEPEGVETDTLVFNVDISQNLRFTCNIYLGIPKEEEIGSPSANCTILKNGSQIERFSTDGHHEYYCQAYPQDVFKIIIVAYGGDVDGASVNTFVHGYEGDELYYSSSVTTWKDYEDTENGIPSFWKPEGNYIWKNDSYSTTKPIFNYSSPGSDWLLKSETSSYDEHGQPTEIKDAKGNSTFLFYGDNNNRTSNDPNDNGLFHSMLTAVQKQALTQEILYDDVMGKVNQIKDSNNNSNYYEYDSFGRLTSIKNNSNELVSNYDYYLSLDGNTNFNSTDPNYTLTNLYRNTVDVSTSVSYFDGLFRNIQTQLQNGTNDIVTKLEYDALDRNNINWKPYSDNTSNHVYQPNDGLNTQNYYSSSGAGPDAGGFPFTKTTFNTNPLNWLLDIYVPGDNFQSHYISNTFNTNKGVDNTGYDEGTLLKQRTKDENQNYSEVYKDKFGNNILQREKVEIFNQYDPTEFYYGTGIHAYPWNEWTVLTQTDYFQVPFDQQVHWETHFHLVITAPPPTTTHGEYWFKIYENDTEIFNSGLVTLNISNTLIIEDSLEMQKGKKYKFVSYAASMNSKFGTYGTLDYQVYDKENVDTQFEYDIIGSLLKVINPKNQVTEYRYNTLGQMIAQATPDLDGDGDGDPTNEVFTDIDDCDIRYKYDKNGNLRFVQDANHRQGDGGDDLVFYQYDELNRQTVIGEASENETIPDWSVLDPDTIYDFVEPVTEIEQFEDLQAYPENLRIQYYYDGDSAYTAAANLLGRISCIKYKTQNQWSYTYYSYTAEGWVEWIVQNIMGLEVKTEYQYDLQGNVTKMIYDSEGPDKMYVWYDYNNLGQLYKVYYSAFNSRPTSYPDATYEYWPTGAVKTLKLGQSGTNDYADILNYTYNERDWLTSINAPDGVEQIDPNNPGSNFATTLYYNTGDGIPYYNGNISVADYFTHNPNSNHQSSATGSHFHRYLFEYDGLDRLVNADYKYPDASSWTNPGNAFNLSGITYDNVGNILSLTRKDTSGGGNPFSFNITTGTNRLEYVNNYKNQSTGNYGYDHNGNLITDYSKAIVSTHPVQYDYRNLPTYVMENNSKDELYYAYDFSGNRVCKKFVPLEGSDNIQYYIYGKDGKTLAVYDKDKKLLFFNLYGLDLIGKAY